MSSHGAAANTKLLNQDLDTSLASLAGNLSVNPGAGNRANLQWTAPTEKKLTGGNNFAGIRPANSTWSQPQQPMGMTPAPQQQFVPQQPYGYNVTSQMPYNTSMYQQPAVQPQFNMYNNNPAMMGMAPPMYQPMRLQQPMTQQPMTMQPQTTNTNQPQDPFGNL
ncbi:unc-11 [Bugula neritina]|uniref:Unc-11 n=1 Tax=Bugula neritina TaxID=10212 RepID=A0A7J7KR20_BUGNE|nr:unc-11 [Bugula neritina]